MTTRSCVPLLVAALPFRRPGRTDSANAQLRIGRLLVTRGDGPSSVPGRVGQRGGRERMTARALVWDMDGTLLDSAAAVPAAFAAALIRIGGPVVSAAEVVAAYPLGTPEVILARLAGRPVTARE